jgi:hypothetical protein
VVLKGGSPWIVAVWTCTNFLMLLVNDICGVSSDTSATGDAAAASTSNEQMNGSEGGTGPASLRRHFVLCAI